MKYVATYGTLRPGCRAEALWKNYGGHHVITGTVDGYALRDYGPFPYAVPMPGHRIIVDVIAVPTELLARLDDYEGYPGHYDRLPVTVETIEKMGHLFDVWLYTPADPDDVSDLPIIPSGDWIAHHEEAYAR